MTFKDATLESGKWCVVLNQTSNWKNNQQIAQPCIQIILQKVGDHKLWHFALFSWSIKTPPWLSDALKESWVDWDEFGGSSCTNSCTCCLSKDSLLHILEQNTSSSVTPDSCLWICLVLNLVRNVWILWERHSHCCCSWCAGEWHGCFPLRSFSNEKAEQHELSHVHRWRLTFELRLHYYLIWLLFFTLSGLCESPPKTLAGLWAGLPRSLVSSSLQWRNTLHSWVPHLSLVILWICIGGISCQTPSGSELPDTLRRCQEGNLWPGIQRRGTVSHNSCQILGSCHYESFWYEQLLSPDNKVVKVKFHLSNTVYSSGASQSLGRCEH